MFSVLFFVMNEGVAATDVYPLLKDCFHVAASGLFSPPVLPVRLCAVELKAGRIIKVFTSESCDSKGVVTISWVRMVETRLLCVGIFESESSYACMNMSRRLLYLVVLGEYGSCR